MANRTGGFQAGCGGLLRANTRPDAAQELFIIQSGEIEIRLGNRVLEVLLQCSIFGEVALIDAAALPQLPSAM
jgi:CRP-like cAMP-binding protein